MRGRVVRVQKIVLSVQQRPIPHLVHVAVEAASSRFGEVVDLRGAIAALVDCIRRTGLTPRSYGAERLFVAGLVSGIVRYLNLREPLESGGVYLSDPVLDGRALDVVDLAVAKGAFEGDELALLESLREF